MNTGLKLALKEGIEARAQRHAFHQTGLKAALKALGLEIYGDEENEMKMVICIKIPCARASMPSLSASFNPVFNA